MTLHRCECGYRSEKACNLNRHRFSCRVSVMITEKDNKIQILEQQIKQLTDMISKSHTDVDVHVLVSENMELKRQNIDLENKFVQYEDENKKKENKKQKQLSINIFPHGEEPSMVREDVLPVLIHPRDSVAEYIQLKYFERPHTRNIRLTNIRGNTLQMWKEDISTRELRWFHVDKKQTIAELTEKNLDELREEFHAERVTIWKEWYLGNKLNIDGYDKQEEWKYILKGVERVLMNNRVDDS